MFAQMQAQTVGRYQKLPSSRRHQIAGAAAAGTALGAIRIAKSPVGRFALQVAKIGVLAKAMTFPSKIVHFGLKAHRVGWTRRQLRKASTVAHEAGIYVTKRGQVLDPQHVVVAMQPFGKRMKAIFRGAV
jgi:hypothetical protein